MDDTRIHTETLEAEDANSNPYVRQMLRADDHEHLLQRTIRDRGRMIWMLFLLLAGSIYSNAYQLTLPKNVPYIHNIDSHGQVVTRILLRPDQVPPDDPGRQAFVRGYLEKWVMNARMRSKDLPLTVRGINTALRMSAGPAQVKLSTSVREEDVHSRIKRETVEIRMPKVPIWIPGTSSWQAEWEEIVTGASNMELRRETWTGTFQIAEQPDWVNEWNSYGIHVVNWQWAPLSK